MEERHGVGNQIVSPIFTLLHRWTSFFPASVIVKVLSSGDTTLITPWVSLTCDLSVKFSQNKRTTFEAGKLGIPLKDDGKNTLVYFVCGGLDEYDNVPDWATELSPKDLSIPTAPGTYHETKGIGIVSLDKKNRDWTYVVKDQDIQVGDFIRVRSEFHEVLGIGRDTFNPNFDCVRFCHDFTNNANNASLLLFLFYFDEKIMHNV